MEVSRRRGLTELEGAVLGTLRQHAPCTPYRIRRLFLDSPSPYWSGSAGAIYPLMGRLENRGLIRAKPGAADRREGRVYELTASGVRAARKWLGPPWPPIVTGVPADPLRTRVAVLDALGRAARVRFFRAAIAAVDEDIRSHLSDRRRGRHAGRPLDEAVARGALAMLRARRRWLAETARLAARTR
jgi:DNA-binding PadR family transcriptional regulator